MGHWQSMGAQHLYWSQALLFPPVPPWPTVLQRYWWPAFPWFVSFPMAPLACTLQYIMATTHGLPSHFPFLSSLGSYQKMSIVTRSILYWITWLNSLRPPRFVKSFWHPGSLAVKPCMCFLLQIRYGYVAEAPVGAILVSKQFWFWWYSLDVRLALHYTWLAILFLGLVFNLVGYRT